jgi:sulfur-carrier protein
MATVFIPPQLRELTAGQSSVTIPGETVQQVVDGLDARYPGIAARLVEDGRIRPGMSVVVDSIVSRQGLRHRLTETSEVHFLPAMSGG